MSSGWGVIRIPLPPISEDAYRYVRDIEQEFQGQPASQILLDEGTWVYWKQRVIMAIALPALASVALPAPVTFRHPVAARRETVFQDPGFATITTRISPTNTIYVQAQRHPSGDA